MRTEYDAKRLNQLANYAMAQRELTGKIQRGVATAREAGASWAEIGEMLGMSKQAAQQKYGKQIARDKSRDENYTEAENNEADKALEALQAVAEQQDEAAKIVEEDRAGQSITPSIFLEPKAPAKRQAKALAFNIDKFHEAEKKELEAGGHILRTKHLMPGEMPTRAEPGTGKGAQQCIGCGSSNHKGVTPMYVYFNEDCAPTRYDTERITNYMMEVNK